MEIEDIVIERLRASSQWINKNQLAAILGISPVTLTTRIRKGLVPEPEEVYGRARWRSDKVADALEAAHTSEDRELTRRQVARKFGVVESTITKWLRNGKFVQPDRLGPHGRMYWKASTITAHELKQTQGFKVGATSH